MAKKVNYETSNNFDIGADLDVPDFNFDDDKPKKDDRKPITKAAHGFLKGARDEVFSTNIIRSSIRNALPPAYGQSAEQVDNVVGTVRDLYSDAVKELRPAVKDLKRTTRKLLPKTEGILPKKLQGFLKDWSAEELEFGANINQQQVRDQGLAIELGKIFQAQAEDTDRREDLSQEKDELKESINQMRHGQSVRQMAGLSEGINRLVAYQDKITINYQRKSLELQYRHYFATVDTLELQREVARTQKAQLDAITKNTGLPEFVKATTSEEFRKGLKNKFAGMLGEGMFGGMRDYLTKFTKNAAERAKLKISDFAGGVRDAASMADMATDTMDTMGDMAEMSGESQHEMGGNMAGGLAAEWGLGKLQKHIGKKIKDHPGLVKGAEKLHYGLNNSENMISDHLNSYDVSWGPFEFLRQFLAESAPSTQADTSLQSHSLMKMDDPTPFNRAASRSIIEIIPGYLARIHREIQVMRTGNEAIPLTTYNYMSNKFSTVKATAKELKGKMFNQYEKDDVHEKLDDIVKSIDDKGSLSPQAREAFKKELLTQSIHRKNTDASHVQRTSHWSGTGEHAGDIAKLFREKLEVDPDTGKRADTLSAIKAQNAYSTKMKNTTSWLNDPRELIQQLRLLGGEDILHELNLLDKKNSDKINLDAFRDMLLEKDGSEEMMPQTTMGGRRKVRRRNEPIMQATQPVRPSAKLAPVQPMQPQIHATAEVQHNAVLDRLNQMLEAVRKLDKSEQRDPAVEQIKDTVLKIEAQLQSGIKVANIDMEELSEKFAAKMGGHFDSAFGSLKEGLSSAKGKIKDAAGKLNNKFRFQDITVGDIYGKAKTGIQKTFGFAKDQVKSLSARGWKLGKIGASAAATGAGIANKALKSKLGEYYGDLYVGQEKLPRLTHARLEAGYYVDAVSGAAITSFKGIAGPVRDIGDSKEGVVVLTLDELKTAYLKGEYPQMLSSIAKGIGELSMAGLFKARGMIKGGFAVALNMGIMAFQKFKEALPPFDVYCKDNMKEPLLYATKMKMGDAYFSKKTGKPINHPRDIDGVIYDKDKNELVSDRQIEIGLVDVNGIAVKNVAGRIGHKVGKVLKAGLGMLKDAGGKIKDMFSGLGNYFRDMFGGIFGLRGEYLQTSKKQLDVLSNIYHLLETRLPKNSKVREGSAEQLEAQENAKEKAQADEVAANNQQANPDGAPGKAGGGGFGLGGMLKKFLTRGKKAEAAEGALGAAEGVAEGAAGSVAAGAAKKGGSLLMRGLRFGGKGLWRAGAVALPWLATEAVPAAIGAAGAIAGGLGALVTGAAALISAPVVLAALGVAAVAYGGYKLYKYLSKMKLDTLSTLRYAQYGFPASDQDHLQAVFNFETAMAKNIKIADGKATLDSAKVDLKELAEGFNVDTKNEDQFRAWVTWANNRAKPVLMATLVNLKSVTDSVELLDVDKKLTPIQKQQFVDKLAGLNAGLYDTLTSPFPDLKNLTVDRNEVQRVIASTREALEAQAKKAADITAKGGPILKTAAVTSALAAQKGMDAKTGGDKAKTGGADTAKMQALTATNAAVSTTSGTKLGAVAADGVAGMFDTIAGTDGKLGALAAIRMKAYGLKDLTQEHIDAIRGLELAISKQVKFGKTGGSWNENVEVLLNYQPLTAKFGLTGARSPQGLQWMSWFKFRFLPVYLNFFTSVWKATGKTNFATFANADFILKPEDALLAGNVMKTTMSVYNGENVVVWKVKEMPWLNVDANTDVNTVELNIDYLNSQVKKSLATDQKDVATKKVTTPSTTAPPAPTEKKPEAPKPTDAQANTAQLMKKAAEGNPNYFSTNASNAALDKPTGFNGGTPVKQPGNGTGGDINNIPQAKGSGWDNVRDTIMAAAKMVGVDPELLAKFAGIESGFDPSAIPKDKNGNRLSNAMGLFQFIPSTWNEMMRKFANKYGIDPRTPASDARANALLGAEYMKGNAQALEKSLGRPATDTDLYLSHFLGQGGANTFLKSNPQAAAATVMPKEAAANPSIFYKGGVPTTFAQIYESFTAKLKSVLSKFKLGGGAITTAATATPAPTAPAKPTTVASSLPSKTSAAVASAMTTPAATSAMAPPQRPSSGPMKLFTPATRDEADLGATAPTSAPTTAPVVTAPAAPATPPVVRPVPNFAGFNPQQQPADTKSQAIALHEMTNDQMQVLAKMGAAQLATQQSMDATLKSILKTINMKQDPSQKTASATPDTPDASTASPARSARFQTTMPTAPVSMDRKW